MGCVEVLGRRVHALGYGLGIRQRRVLRALQCVVEELLHAGADLFLFLVRHLGVVAQPGAEALDRIGLRPLLEHLLRDVEGVVVHGVAFHAEGHALDQRRAPVRARLFDRALRLAVNGEDVGAVDDDPVEAVRLRAVGDVLDCVAQVRWRRVGPLVVVADEHHGKPAKFIPSCVSPRAAAPSPNQPTATRFSSRMRNASAQPTATGSIAGRWLTIASNPRRASAMWTLPSFPRVGPSARPMYCAKIRHGSTPRTTWTPMSRCSGVPTSSGPIAVATPTEAPSLPRPV